MAKKESKKKSQIMLWVGISFISVAVITFLIFGFSTQWTFKPNSTKSNKQSNNGNVEPLFNDNNNRNIIYDYDFEIESQKISPEDESKITIPEKQEKSEEKKTDNFATSILKYHNEIRTKCGKYSRIKME